MRDVINERRKQRNPEKSSFFLSMRGKSRASSGSNDAGIGASGSNDSHITGRVSAYCLN